MFTPKQFYITVILGLVFLLYFCSTISFYAGRRSFEKETEEWLNECWLQHYKIPPTWDGKEK